VTTILIIISRILLGGYFLQSGLRNLQKLEAHTGILRSKGVPMPRVALIVALAVQIVGGLSVVLGVYPAIGAIGLIGFTVLASVLYHNIFAYQGEERMSHLGSVLTNLALIGGLLSVVATS
jgi:putative oxidoreductase